MPGRNAPDLTPLAYSDLPDPTSGLLEYQLLSCLAMIALIGEGGGGVT